MFTKFLRTSFATLGIAASPIAAEAALYEAVWQVQLIDESQFGQHVDINRSNSFEYKVRFSDEIWYIDEFETDTMVFFDRAPIVHIRPELTYLPNRPDGGTIQSYNNFLPLFLIGNVHFQKP